MWIKMLIWGAAASVLAVSACASSGDEDEYADPTGAADVDAAESEAAPLEPRIHLAPRCRRDPTKSYISRSPAQCAAIRFKCEEGYAPFFDDCGCGCQKQLGGEPCGPNVCGAGLYCCNASCGICVPPGRVCIQIACD